MEPVAANNNRAAAVIRKILRYEMQLANNRIWIRNQNIKLPKIDEMFIALGMVDAPSVISNTNKVTEKDGGLYEEQRIVMRENVQVDVFSRNNDAIERHWEVAAALTTTYAQQEQEINGCRIFGIPTTWANSSDTEGAEKINKFSIIIATHVWYAKGKQIGKPFTNTETGNNYGDWYDEFTSRIDDENTIGTETPLFQITQQEE